MLVLGRGNGWPSRDISRRAKTAVDEGRPPAMREPSVHRVLHERGSSAKSESTVDHAVPNVAKSVQLYSKWNTAFPAFWLRSCSNRRRSRWCDTRRTFLLQAESTPGIKKAKDGGWQGGDVTYEDAKWLQCI